MQDLIRIKEVSEILGLQADTIRSYVCNKKIKAIKKDGVKSLFFDRYYIMYLERYGIKIGNKEWSDYLINKELEE